MPKPTLGRTVLFTAATGNQYAATIVMTEDGWSPGRFVNIIAPEQRLARYAEGNGPQRRYDGAERADIVDVDGDRWQSSPIPQVKPGRVHLKVLSPTGDDFVEYNVPNETIVDGKPTPATWSWPVIETDPAIVAATGNPLAPLDATDAQPPEVAG